LLKSLCTWYLLVIVAALLLPETRDKVLDAVTG
jgi:hypothetical protein